ncbi:DEAD/DEAH box helicase [Striga asiatica]|uniref:DEAD/DEAH box helicase n=1 Tax=Striga asiatica TaxID=4170 RepID=A0A5A7QM46_STRAF|nr:DEAD/DEAH box helicase [Striga asiatica]
MATALFWLSAPCPSPPNLVWLSNSRHPYNPIPSNFTSSQDYGRRPPIPVTSFSPTITHTLRSFHCFAGYCWVSLSPFGQSVNSIPQYSRQHEETMGNFAQGHIKILVCTNIVESGLDIQNANTIVIQDIQLFGLAQLYQLRGRVGRADKEAHEYLFYPDKSLLSDLALERLAALEECRDLGQGFQLAERDMGIRGFGNIFGEQQTGDVGNVGIDLFFEMLFESLSMVDEHRLVSVLTIQCRHINTIHDHTIPIHVQFDLDLKPHLPSQYINHLENPLEIINEAENAAQRDIWNLVLFTEDLHRHYGKEPYSMEILLKKLYIRRMAADLGITEIYISGKMVGMKTSMSEKVFKMMKDSMPSETHRSSIVFEDGSIKFPTPKNPILHPANLGLSSELAGIYG